MRKLPLALCVLLVTGCWEAPPAPPPPPEAPAAMLAPLKITVVQVAPSEARPPKPADCALPVQQSGPPPADTRTIVTIELTGELPAQTDVWSLVKQRACESGADLVWVRQFEKKAAGAMTGYHIVAYGLVHRSH